MKFSRRSLIHQITKPTVPTSTPFLTNPYQSLSGIDDPIDIMDIDEAAQNSESHPGRKVVSWSTDAGIASLTEELFSHMIEKKQTAKEAGDIDSDFPEYKKPQWHFDSKKN
jgi:hypothetical protein